MIRMSSMSTFFWKFLFPGVWIASLIWGIIQTIWRGVRFSEPIFEAKTIFGLIFFSAISLIAIRFLGSLKTVTLNGDSLIVSNFFRSIRLPLIDVAFVNDPDMTSHRRISLSLSSRSAFGDQIVFMPPFFAAQTKADLLRSRIEAAEKAEAERKT